MTRVYQVLIGGFAALFAFMGAQFYLTPVEAGGNFGLEAMSPVGLNALHGDLGGLFVASSLLLLWALIRSNGHMLRAVAVLMGAIALGRVIGFATGPVVVDSVIALAVEIAVVAVTLRASLLAPWTSRLTAERPNADA